MKKLLKAFTLVEVLVAIAIMSIITGAGVTVSYQAAQRKKLDQAAIKLEGAYKTARAYAQAGKKINCTASPLGGWGVKAFSDRYELREWCGTITDADLQLVTESGNLIERYDYKDGVSLSTLSNPPVIIFKPLGQGIYTPRKHSGLYNYFCGNIWIRLGKRNIPLLLGQCVHG